MFGLNHLCFAVQNKIFFFIGNAAVIDDFAASIDGFYPVNPFCVGTKSLLIAIN